MRLSEMTPANLTSAWVGGLCFADAQGSRGARAASALGCKTLKEIEKPGTQPSAERVLQIVNADLSEAFRFRFAALLRPHISRASSSPIPGRTIDFGDRS